MAKIDGARIQQVKLAIKEYGKNANWDIKRAFETIGCSCGPDRARLDELDSLCLQAEIALENSPLFKEREQLRASISTRDRAEHPGLDSMARTAMPFFNLWLFDRLSSPDGNKSMAYKDVAADFAKDWLAGWRPIMAMVEATIGEE